MDGWVDDCIIVDNDPSLREEFVRYLSTIHPTEDKGELTWVLQVKVARNRPNRTLTLSQEMYVNDLVKRHGQLIVGLSHKFDSPFEANLELSHDQCPTPNSPEQVEMEPYREAYTYVTHWRFPVAIQCVSARSLLYLRSVGALRQ